MRYETNVIGNIKLVLRRQFLLVTHDRFQDNNASGWADIASSCLFTKDRENISSTVFIVQYWTAERFEQHAASNIIKHFVIAKS